MAKCLVLGANGFLGSHLVDALRKRRHTIRAFDRFDTDVRFIDNAKIQKVTGDFFNRHDLREALRGIDYVFHFISTTTPLTAEDDPLIDIETNMKMSVRLFEECVKQKVKKIIFPSTGGAIYGMNAKRTRISESVTPLPISPYAIGKLAIEHYLQYFKRKHSLSSVVFRISNPYGDRQALNSKQGVIPIFLEHIARNEPITVLGDGSMVRDYIYIYDAAEMIAESFLHTKQNVYNLGSGRGVSINELIKTIRKVVGKPFTIEHRSNLSTFIERVVLDVSRFQSEFHVRPETLLEDGIRKTWMYIQKHSL